MEQHTFKPPCGRRFRFRGVVLLLILFCFTSCLVPGKHVKKETFYIPKGVTGYIYILFNCKDGKPKKWVNGRRLYEIPPSGVLKTQFKHNYGYLIYENEAESIKKRKEYAKFYYVDENYKPIKKINYAPYYVGDYNSSLLQSENVTGKNILIAFGNGETNYRSNMYYIFNGNKIDYKKINYNNQTEKDWYRINNWNTYDMRKDSIK